MPDQGSEKMSTEHLDVLIVGAGLSGIGAAHHLQRALPRQELRDPRGARRTSAAPGTSSAIPGSAPTPTCTRWATTSGPGPRRRRSPTAPRSSTTSATPPARAGSRRRSASATASSAPSGRARRRAGASRPSAATAGETVNLTCGFLFMCSGYYRYDEGYTPEFPGRERFGGEIVHPQHWPADLDYAGKRVVVIGSGATAMTLVPALAADAAKVTMLQRSPTYVVSMPARRRDRQLAAQGPAGEDRLRDRALEERHHAGPQLPALAQAAEADEEAAAPRPGKSAAGRLRHRQALQAPLQPLGPAALPGSRRRPLPGALRRQRRDRHRLDQELRRGRDRARVRREAGGRHHHHRDRPQRPLPRRHDGQHRRRASPTWRSR